MLDLPAHVTKGGGDRGRPGHHVSVELPIGVFDSGVGGITLYELSPTDGPAKHSFISPTPPDSPMKPSHPRPSSNTSCKT